MKCECGYTPAVIVHGLGQFESFETDENGGILGRAWPLQFDTERLKRTLLLPAAKMMLLRRDAGFTDRLKKAWDICSRQAIGGYCLRQSSCSQTTAFIRQMTRRICRSFRNIDSKKSTREVLF